MRIFLKISFCMKNLSNILKMSSDYILSDLNFVIPELSDVKGNILTLRASSIDNALSKLISAVISADNISEKYAKTKVLTNIDYIIQLNRMNDGVRRVTSVVELTPARTAALSIKVIAKYEDRVTCKVIDGGVLGNRKSMSVPGIKLDIPFISEEDRKDIIYACEHGGEFLALSFVSTKEDVLEVKEILREYNREDLQIICKIESALGIENLEDILSVSDGVMVARGDLGTEVPSEMVPIYQKQMINTCRRLGKISIVATEMLETMMDNIRPKRAETSDIANAVLDGTDAVMLSGETTVGKHPVETVAAMANICETTEKYASFDYAFDIESLDNITKSIASERAISRIFASLTMSEIIKSEYDKLKNPGRRNDLKKYNNAQNPIDAICQVFGKSKKVIQRYLRITYLTDEFKELVDKGVIRPYIAASISFLSENEQRVLYKILASNNVKLKIDLADALKKASKDIKPKELNERDILNIFQEFKDIKESEKRT